MKKVYNPHDLAVTVLAKLIKQEGFNIQHEQVLPNLVTLIKEARMVEADSLYNFDGCNHNLDIWTGEVTNTTKADHIRVLKDKLAELDEERRLLKLKIASLKATDV